eukprot:scaffold1987_cov377-Prasinococcus_capsulatus_cf.AAC.7
MAPGPAAGAASPQPPKQAVFVIDFGGGSIKVGLAAHPTSCKEVRFPQLTTRLQRRCCCGL